MFGFDVSSHRDAMRKATRAGYAARGVVFLVIGFFAFRAAYAAGRPMSPQEAVDTIAGSTFGVILLALLAVALASFALWRLAQVILDIDGHGHTAKGVAIRGGLLVSAFSYGALAVYAVSILVGMGRSGGGAGKGIVAAAYQAGYGEWLTYAIAAALAGAAVAHIVKGLRAGFEKYMDLPPQYERWLKPLCQFGLVARGVTFLVLAGLLVTGAASYAGNSSPGLRTALSEMSSWTFGWFVLAVMGAGLMAFGAYAICEARYRRIRLEAIG